jgi:hypothetical protein
MNRSAGWPNATNMVVAHNKAKAGRRFKRDMALNKYKLNH